MWMVNGQVIRARKRHFIDGNGNKQRGIVLVKWTKEALAEIGVKRFVEIAYDKELLVSTGYTDEEVDGVIIRTHTTEERVFTEEQKLERVLAARRAAYPPIGDQLDAVLKQMNAMRFAQTAVAEATTIKALREAVAPAFAFPEELDGILADWTKVKADFPKE